MLDPLPNMLHGEANHVLTSMGRRTARLPSVQLTANGPNGANGPLAPLPAVKAHSSEVARKHLQLQMAQSALGNRPMSVHAGSQMIVPFSADGDSGQNGAAAPVLVVQAFSSGSGTNYMSKAVPVPASKRTNGRASQMILVQLIVSWRTGAHGRRVPLLAAMAPCPATAQCCTIARMAAQAARGTSPRLRPARKQIALWTANSVTGQRGARARRAAVVVSHLALDRSWHLHVLVAEPAEVLTMKKQCAKPSSVLWTACGQNGQAGRTAARAVGVAIASSHEKSSSMHRMQA